jgi:hypothetical protein
MTIYVEITDEPVTPGGVYTAEGISKIRPARQNAYLHQGAAYPVPFNVAVDDATGPLRPGRYLLSGAPFVPGQYGLDWRSTRLKLVPLEEAVAQLTGSKPRAVAA